MSTTSSLLIKKAWTADGKGSPLHRADLLIREGRVAAIEPEILGNAGAELVTEAHGCIAAPGFIDAHGHSDLALFARPEAFSKVSQGVTTEIAGNCGLSAFPLTGLNREHLEELYRRYGVPLEWQTLPEMQRALAERNPALHLHFLTGANTLRAAVAGYEKCELDPRQMDRMLTLLQQSFDGGSPGLSLGLLYVPGMFATPDELLALFRLTAQNGKAVTTHLASEGVRLLESLQETLDLARRAGLKKIRISHFKTAGQANWHKLEDAIALIEEARAQGLDVAVDRYPYTASMTQLSVMLPGEWSEVDDASIRRRLADPETARRTVAELAAARDEAYFCSVRLIASGAASAKGCEGLTVSQAAAKAGLAPAEWVVRVLAEDSPGTTAAFSGMSEENLRRILSLAYCDCGSDENARPLDDSIGRGHPRAFGSLPRFLRMVLAAGLPVEKAVERVTGQPARWFGLGDAGLLQTGCPADVVLFDPETLDGSEDFAAPHTPATGIRLTLTGGRIVYRN